MKPALLLLALLLPLAPILDALPHRCGHDGETGHIHIGTLLVTLDGDDRPLVPVVPGDPVDGDGPHHCQLAASDVPTAPPAMLACAVLIEATPVAWRTERPDGPAFPPDPPPIRAG